MFPVEFSFVSYKCKRQKCLMDVRLSILIKKNNLKREVGKWEKKKLMVKGQGTVTSQNTFLAITQQLIYS